MSKISVKHFETTHVQVVLEQSISHFHISLAVQVYLFHIWLPGYPRNGWDGFLDTRHETSETSIDHSLG